MTVEELQGRIDRALEVIDKYGGTQEIHHATWIIDQVARRLLGDQYEAWVRQMTSDGHDWDVGIAP